MVKKIVLSMAAILFACASVLAQNKQVSGTVTSPDGSPVVGATVVVEGTSLGTSTDMQGKYMLAAPTNGTLVFSFIGYEDAKLAINGKTTVNVVLKEASKAIDDVIVVAFGEAKKEAFTGSAKVVSSEDLTKTQSSNVSDALVGKVAGMQTASPSGRPGSGQNLTIRGPGSIYSGTSPLWVVDGMPYAGDINNINPADIESITVLKDAASNALYGAHGANGVIMVTTKRAKAGDARVTFDGKWGLNTRALQTYDYVDNAGEYYELHYQALYNNYAKTLSAAEAHKKANEVLISGQPGGLGYNVMTVPAGQLLIGSNGKLNPNATVGRLHTYKYKDENGVEQTENYWLKPDDWLNALYKPSFRQEYNVNVSAAGEKSNFFASFGYLDNNGIIDGSKQERLTTRLRADYQAKKWLKVGGNFSYTHYKRHQGDSNEGAGDGGDVFAAALNTAPIYPLHIRDSKGNLMYDELGLPVYDTGDGSILGPDAKRPSGSNTNYLREIQLNKHSTEGNAFSAQGFAEVRFYRDLKFIFNANMNLDEGRSTDLLNPYYGQFAENGGIVSKSHSRDISYELQQLLNYTHTFGSSHNLDVLLGHTSYTLKTYGLGASKSKMFSYDYDELSGLIIDGQSASSNFAQYVNEGYFVRAQYDYDQRYFFSGSYRRDASSNFHPDNRWGNFWSVSAAWLMNKESWFNAPWVDMLKIKASYGVQGNDKLGGYTISQYYVDAYTIKNNGSDGVATTFSQKGNKDITWESNGNLNAGVEFSFWKGRLYGNVDYFHRKTSDMLFFLSVPASLGYSGYYTNLGDMVNQGIEAELGADIIRRKNFVWNFGLNLTHYKNKITRLPDEYKNNTTDDGKLKGYNAGSMFYAEGQPFFSLYMPTYAGVNPETGKSEWLVYDEDGNESKTDLYSEASQKGRAIQGDATPDLYGGFNTSFMFFGVDISANFTYQIGGLVYDGGYAAMMDSPLQTSVGRALHRDLWDAWSEDNKDSNIPRFQYGDQYSAARSSRFLTDASYLNIQNITIGYTLPAKITRKFLVEKLRVYLSCDNVFYWSQRQGLDPRQSISGSASAYKYSPIRTFSGGVTLTF